MVTPDSSQWNNHNACTHTFIFPSQLTSVCQYQWSCEIYRGILHAPFLKHQRFWACSSFLSPEHFIFLTLIEHPHIWRRLLSPSQHPLLHWVWVNRVCSEAFLSCRRWLPVKSLKLNPQSKKWESSRHSVVPSPSHLPVFIPTADLGLVLACLDQRSFFSLVYRETHLNSVPRLFVFVRCCHTTQKQICFSHVETFHFPCFFI